MAQGYAVYDLVFEINTGDDVTPVWTAIGGIDTLGEIAIDNQKVDVTDLQSQGWIEELITAKQISMECTGHREEGDVGQDFVQALAFQLGANAQKTIKITFPNTDTLEMKSNIEVTSIGGGGVNDKSAFGMTVTSTGAPTYTAA